jgi:ABC-type sugar transport system substrate-binding protein
MVGRPASAFPNFDDRRVVDSHMDHLDTHGISRREFLSFASASAAATAAAVALGLPSVAVADPSGKLAYLTGFLRNEWNQLVAAGATQAAKDFGLNFVVLDSHLNAQEQTNQFEQQAVGGAQGIILNLSDGGTIRRLAQQAKQDQIYIANIWDSQPWFTPFDANDYWTLYAQPEEFSSIKEATGRLLKLVTETFGGGEIAGVTGNDGSTLDIERSAGRDAAFPAYPKTKLVGTLPGLWNREDSLKAAAALLSRHPNIKGFVAQNDDVALGILAALHNAGLEPGKDVFVVSTDGTTEAARLIKRGQILITAANPGTYAGGFFTARIYDVTHGWTPRNTERLLAWRSVLIDASNIDAYIARHVDNGGKPPFNYRLMSKVAHPKDWDPQQEVYPFDLDVLWAKLPKPAGYEYPKQYTEAKTNGEWDAVRKEYADHYKFKFLDPLSSVPT